MSAEKVTIGDLLDAIDTINKFVNFGEKVAKVFSALSRAGVDINRIDPYDFNSILQLSMAMRSNPELKEIDIESLKEEFKEILELELDDVYEKLDVIRKFVSVYNQASRTVGMASEMVGASLDQLNALANTFGLKLPTTLQSEETEEMEVEEMNEDEIKELNEVIKKFKSRNV